MKTQNHYKRYFNLLIALAMLIILTFVVVAVFGHSASQTLVNTPKCGEVDLQYALDNNCFTTKHLECSRVAGSLQEASFVPCPTGTVTLGGGCVRSSGTNWDHISRPQGRTVNGQYLEGWACQVTGGSVTAYAMCCSVVGN
ncbi:hypothetical protein J4225_04010 [Candidatus Pacearchaeota archaeon]|nr:hypothetical protein [Candidatus Pacearchaeota archaeon]